MFSVKRTRLLYYACHGSDGTLKYHIIATPKNVDTPAQNRARFE